MSNQSTKNCDTIIYDIAIVGGGMSGATAALCYAQLGLKIVLIEAIEPSDELTTSFDHRAVALSAASVEIFNTLGCWQKLKPYACPIKNIHVSDQNNYGFTRLNAQEHNVNALGEVIPLELAGPVLWQIVEEEKNIQTFCPAKVDDIKTAEKFNLITIKTSSEIMEKLSAKLVLAADGTFSKIAEKIGIELDRKNYSQNAVIANIETEMPHQNKAFERFTKDGPLALLPLTNNRLSLVWCHKPDNAQQAIHWSDEKFCQELQKSFGYRLGQIKKVGKRFLFPLGLHQTSTPFKNRVLLMGNAAHTLHPIAGQGFNLGLRDIAALNDVLIEALKNNKDIGSNETLSRFVTLQKPDWQQTIYATDWLARAFSNDFFPLVMTRNKAMNIVNLFKPLKDQLAQSAMGFQNRSPRLARGLPNTEINSQVPTI